MKKKNMEHKAEQNKASEPQTEEVKEETQQPGEQAPGQTDGQAAEQTPEHPASDDTQELKDKLAAANDSYLRLAAEFDNFRRRSAKERLDLVTMANEKLIQEMLPIIDDFERALAALRDSEDSASAKEGTELIYNKIIAFLKKNGVSEIEALGQEFDTDYHEAVAQFPVEDAQQKNKVVEVAQKGYKMGDKVIRYAKVVIGI